MKVVTTSYSGSTGKTTITSHMLAPRMPDARIFAIESTNETASDLGLEIDLMRGEHFGRLFREILATDDAIIDVGASNIEDFLDQMMKYDGSHEEFDFFVLPVIGTGKAQRETISTIKALAGLGVDPNRIRVVFNRVKDDVRDEFAAIFGYQIAANSFTANAEAAVYENDIFDMLAAQRTTIAAVLADETDYKQLIKAADKSDQAAISHLTNRYALKSLARSVVRNLDQAYAALFTDPGATAPKKSAAAVTQLASSSRKRA